MLKQYKMIDLTGCSLDNLRYVLAGVRKHARRTLSDVRALGDPKKLSGHTKIYAGRALTMADTCSVWCESLTTADETKETLVSTSAMALLARAFGTMAVLVQSGNNRARIAVIEKQFYALTKEYADGRLQKVTDAQEDAELISLLCCLSMACRKLSVLNWRPFPE
jgi:hypothetical protein